MSTATLTERPTPMSPALREALSVACLEPINHAGRATIDVVRTKDPDTPFRVVAAEAGARRRVVASFAAAGTANLWALNLSLAPQYADNYLRLVTA